MKTGEAISLIGAISQKTIRVWCDQQELEPYLTPGARGIDRPHRSLSDKDVGVLRTVYLLRNRDGITNWKEIADFLETGERYPPPTADGMVVDHETVSRPYAEQSARAAATVAERDAALARVNELEELVKQMQLEAAEREVSIRAEYEERIEKLYERIGDLRQQIGRLEERTRREDE